MIRARNKRSPRARRGDAGSTLSRKDGRAWRARWKAVRKAELAELRATPLDVKLRQLDALMASAHLFPKTAAEEKEERMVRNRWNRLRKILHA
jgi:hypothetical protein